MPIESIILSYDRLNALLRQEKAYKIESSYIPDAFSDEVVGTYAKWRYQMVEWFQELIRYFQYQPDTLEVAMSILDRYVAAKPEIMERPREYQMAAVTSLYIAAKMHEPRGMTADQIYDLSTELYRAEKSLEQEELDILHTIGWRVNPPTPTALMREMLCMIPTD